MKFKTYSNLFKIAWGLRFYKELKNEGIILRLPKEMEIRLSMYFVFFPITALWVSKDNIINHVQNLQPFTVSQKKKALYIVEMPLNNKYKTGMKFKIEKFKYKL